MHQYQPYVQQLADLTFTIGTTQVPQVIQMRDLEKKMYGEAEIANLIGLVLECDLVVTAATLPTMIGHNNALANVQFNDGADILFDGQGNDLRMFESLENGKTVLGEAATQTSTNHRYWSRFLPMGPMGLMGSPSDYAIPCAELAEGGSLKVTPGVLTDLSADASAATLVVHVGAILAPSGKELKVGPKYQRLVRANSGSGFNISDEALYAYLGAVDVSYGAFGVAAFSKIIVRTTKRGRYVNNVDAELLARVFNSQMQPGSIDQIIGEQRDATFDVAPRIVNFGTPTALAAQSGALQPILWCPKSTRLSKVKARVDQNDTMTIEHSGDQGANGSYLFGRFLPHTGDSIAKRVRKAASALGLSTGNLVPKTLSKKSTKPSVQQAKYGVWAVKAA